MVWEAAARAGKELGHAWPRIWAASREAKGGWVEQAPRGGPPLLALSWQKVLAVARPDDPELLL